jgi:hypothetical protein
MLSQRIERRFDSGPVSDGEDKDGPPRSTVSYRAHGATADYDPGASALETQTRRPSREGLPGHPLRTVRCSNGPYGGAATSRGPLRALGTQRCRSPLLRCRRTTRAPTLTEGNFSTVRRSRARRLDGCSAYLRRCPHSSKYQ